MYWHSTLRHILPVLRKVRMSPFFLSEESFEASFRQVKKILRSRSNNHVSRDLESLRAFAEAHSYIRKEWGCRTNLTNDWPVCISRDLLVAPCITEEPFFLANMPGLVRELSILSGEWFWVVTIQHSTYTYFRCGDVADPLVLCSCGKHFREIPVMQLERHVVDVAQAIACPPPPLMLSPHYRRRQPFILVVCWDILCFPSLQRFPVSR